MKSSIKSIIVLVGICTVMTVLLALVNSITAPIIQENQNAAANAALLEVMPEGKNFEQVDISAYELPATVTQAHKEEGGGFVIQLTTKGYGSDFVIICGVRADGTISGAKCLSSTETLGKEKTYGENFTDKNAEQVAAVETISGATKTTQAYKNAVNDAINAAIILAGGSVDIRTEEEILADNLAAALPAGEGKFTKLFIVEVIEGIDAVYTADNGKGSVCVVGETFVGIDETGKALTDDTALATKLEAQIQIIAASEQTPVDLTAYEGIHKNIVSVSKTATGNYVLEVKGAGYGITGGDEYHPASGEYIVIRVSMTPQGKIIDTLTVSQKETDNIGSVCADEKFYGQFDGKTQADYDSVEGISGATLTTKGYKQAILRCFEAVAILEGGVANEE